MSQAQECADAQNRSLESVGHLELKMSERVSERGRREGEKGSEGRACEGLQAQFRGWDYCPSSQGRPPRSFKLRVLCSFVENGLPGTRVVALESVVMAVVQHKPKGKS